LLSFRHEDIVDRLLSHVKPDKRRPGELFEYLFDMDEGLCNLYDEGLVSSKGFYSEIDRRFALGVGFEGFVPLWNDIFAEKEDVSQIVRAVIKKRPVYLLSNVNELHWEFVKGRFGILGEMDGHVLSYVVKSKKPKPAIYGAAMEMAGIGPGESVFIDDLPENVDAATSCGIRGIAFKGAAALRPELARLGLLG